MLEVLDSEFLPFGLEALGFNLFADPGNQRTELFPAPFHQITADRLFRVKSYGRHSISAPP